MSEPGNESKALPADTPSNSPPPDEKAVSSPATSFEQAAHEEQPGIVAEFLEFLVESKAWWLTPIIVVLLLVGLLIVLSSSAIAPFIYPIF